MDTREFPVLTDEDGDLVERLAVGLDNDAAHVLAYLLLRRGGDRFADEPATRIAIRIGTSLNRDAAADALSALEERDLVTATTVRKETRGRPPKAWCVPDSTETVVENVYTQHAAALLGQANTVATALGVEPFEESVTEKSQTEPLRLGLNWRKNTLHAPFFLAVSNSDYEKNGVTLDISHHRGSGRALDSLVAGTTDVALAGAATTVRARSAGKPVLPIALLFQRAMAVLYTTRDAFGTQFETIEQLRGRRVGMSSASETGLLGRLFLSQAGILDDVTVVDITGEEQSMLRAGRADVVMGSFADPQQLRTTGKTIDSLLVADRFPLYGPALVTTERTMRERPLMLERFLAGTVMGWAEARQHPAAAVRAVDMENESALDDERRTFERAVSEFTTGSAVEKHGWGWQRVEGWNRLVTALNHVEVLE